MDRAPVREARLIETEAGLRPDGDGWFVVNVADAVSYASEGAGHMWPFEPEPRSFPHFGINVHVLAPGEPACMYHAEGAQEAFLVLQGECILVVEDEERRLRQWDFFHAAPWTGHTFLGAGDGPCAVLMIGGHHPDESIVYPVSDVASKHRAGVERETEEPAEAYGQMRWAAPEPARRPWPPT